MFSKVGDSKPRELRNNNCKEKRTTKVVVMFIPPDLYDPISGDLMKDPVIAADGHTYSRETITMWFAQCQRTGKSITSPLTRKDLSSEALKENITLKKIIDSYIQEEKKNVLSQRQVEEDRRDWEPRHDEKSGKPWYYNTKTRQSSWAIPLPFDGIFTTKSMHDLARFTEPTQSYRHLLCLVFV